ncbi:MAG: HAD family hydrolase, partial [Dehalococcoidales bacterium]
TVGKEYPICLSSDTDDDMLGSLRALYPFDKIFTSEEIGAFKTGSEGRFFKAVVDHYGITPDSIIHVGDTIADIAGASEAGLTTCWLNRTGRTWPYVVKPDIEVSSLLEFTRILNVDVNPDTIQQE